MSRDYRPSVVYAKPHKERSKSQPPLERQRPKYDTRGDAYHLYQNGRQSREPDRYSGTRYVFDSRQDGYRKPTVYQDHYNSHLDDRRQDPRRHADRDHYNPQYKYPSGNQPRFDDPRYAAPRHDQRYISDNRKYQVPPREVYGHPGAPQRGYHKDYDQNPLKELFQPPEGYDRVHEADVHQDPRPPSPAPPEEHPDEEKKKDTNNRKPRKIREYRIFRKNRKEESSSSSSSSESESSSDEEEDRKHRGSRHHREKERERKGDKPGKGQPPDSENWYTKTHPAKFIKLGDISYVRAHRYNKKSVEHLMSAFEAFGFVIIGIVYKGGDALLKVIAPVAAIKAYTALLSPALQAIVGGVTGGVVKGLK